MTKVSIKMMMDPESLKGLLRKVRVCTPRYFSPRTQVVCMSFLFPASTTNWLSVFKLCLCVYRQTIGIGKRNWPVFSQVYVYSNSVMHPDLYVLFLLEYHWPLARELVLMCTGHMKLSLSPSTPKGVSLRLFAKIILKCLLFIFIDVRCIFIDQIYLHIINLFE